MLELTNVLISVLYPDKDISWDLLCILSRRGFVYNWDTKVDVPSSPLTITLLIKCCSTKHPVTWIACICSSWGNCRIINRLQWVKLLHLLPIPMLWSIQSSTSYCRKLNYNHGTKNIRGRGTVEMLWRSKNIHINGPWDSDRRWHPTCTHWLPKYGIIVKFIPLAGPRQLSNRRSNPWHDSGSSCWWRNRSRCGYYIRPRLLRQYKRLLDKLKQPFLTKLFTAKSPGHCQNHHWWL